MSNDAGDTPQDRALAMLEEVSKAPADQRSAVLDKMLDALPPDERKLIAPWVAGTRLTMPEPKPQPLLKPRIEWERIALFTFTALFLVGITFAVFKTPTLTEDQRKIVRLVLALIAGGFGTFIPGLFTVQIKGTGFLIRAASACAFFVIAYFFNPAT